MTLVIAHRGASLDRVENTLDAIVTAVRLGADAVEVDVRCTRDGVPVLHHDPDLARVWGHPGVIRSMSAQRLRREVPDVPTLHEALAQTRQLAVPLVLDVATIGAARAAAAVLAREPGRRAGELVWFCGRLAPLAWIRRWDPDATVMLSWYGPVGPGSALTACLRPQFFNPHHRWLDERALRHWQDRGTAVSTWTVDEAQRRDQLLSWGTDAIISNDVSSTRAAVDRHQHPVRHCRTLADHHQGRARSPNRHTTDPRPDGGVRDTADMSLDPGSATG